MMPGHIPGSHSTVCDQPPSCELTRSRLQLARANKLHSPAGPSTKACKLLHGTCLYFAGWHGHAACLLASVTAAQGAQQASGLSLLEAMWHEYHMHYTGAPHADSKPIVHVPCFSVRAHARSLACIVSHCLHLTRDRESSLGSPYSVWQSLIVLVAE